jgi:hypothetical protein
VDDRVFSLQEASSAAFIGRERTAEILQRLTKNGTLISGSIE